MAYIIFSGIPQQEFKKNKTGIVETYRQTAQLTNSTKFIAMEFNWWPDRNDNNETRLIIYIYIFNFTFVRKRQSKPHNNTHLFTIKILQFQE